MRRVIIKVALVLGFVLALLVGRGDIVAALDISQHSLTVLNQSPTTIIHDAGVGSLEIAPDLEFSKLNDFIAYKLVLQNNDGKRFKVTDITDDNANVAIQLDYAYPTTLDANNKEITITIRYVKVSPDPLTTVTVTISLEDADDVSQQINLTIPSTGANTTADYASAVLWRSLTIYTTLVIIIATAYIIIRYIQAKKGKDNPKRAKFLLALALVFALAPSIVIAVSKDLPFIIELSNVQLNDSYTIYYDSNGGAGNMNSQTLATGQTAKLAPNEFTRRGFSFNGWNTASDGNGTNYINEQQITNLLNPGESITLYAQWKLECSPFNICYDDNGANSPFTMSNQSVDPAATQINLWPSNFKYSGGDFGFAGWSEDKDAGVKLLDTDPSNDSIIYGPNETINFTAGEYNVSGPKLYAVWIANAGNIQSWQGCAALGSGKVTALKDTRDNNTYAVAKLADGKCWMIENLRLGGTSSITLTSRDSNVATDFTLPASQDPTTTAWCANSNATCVNQSRISSANTTNPVTNMITPELDVKDTAGIYSFGNYYNWYSATAGTGTYSLSSGDATSSICPVGWRLPTGNTGGEFSLLYSAIVGTGIGQGTIEASKRWRTYPNNFAYSGSAVSSLFNSRGLYTYAWSSTAGPLGRAYNLNFSSSNLSPGTGGLPKYYGFSVRCVAN